MRPRTTDSLGTRTLQSNGAASKGSPFNTTAAAVAILRGEVVSAIVKNRDYIGRKGFRKGFEVTDSTGRVNASGMVGDDVPAQRTTAAAKKGPIV
jgi:hypothetical protein